MSYSHTSTVEYQLDRESNWRADRPSNNLLISRSDDQWTHTGSKYGNVDVNDCNMASTNTVNRLIDNRQNANY